NLPTLKLAIFNNLCRFVLTPGAFEYPLVVVGLVWLDACQPHHLPTLRAVGPLKCAQRIWRRMRRLVRNPVVGHERSPSGEPDGCEMQCGLTHERLLPLSPLKSADPSVSVFNK